VLISYGRILHKLNTRRNPDNTPMLGSNIYAPARIPDTWQTYIWIDVGWSHPTCALIAHMSDDARIWIDQEYYATERTARENARAIKALIGNRAITAVYGSPDANAKDQTSGRSAADDYRDEGLNIIPAVTEHDHSANQVNQMLHAEALERLNINERCARTIKQLEGYTWQHRRKKASGGHQTADPDGGDWDGYDTVRMGAVMMPTNPSVDRYASQAPLSKGMHKPRATQGGY
jgi:Terminase RNaseH-like domain